MTNSDKRATPPAIVMFIIYARGVAFLLTEATYLSLRAQRSNLPAQPTTLSLRAQRSNPPTQPTTLSLRGRRPKQPASTTHNAVIARPKAEATCQHNPQRCHCEAEGRSNPLAHTPSSLQNMFRAATNLIGQFQLSCWVLPGMLHVGTQG